MNVNFNEENTVMEITTNAILSDSIPIFIIVSLFTFASIYLFFLSRKLILNKETNKVKIISKSIFKKRNKKTEYPLSYIKGDRLKKRTVVNKGKTSVSYLLHIDTEDGEPIYLVQTNGGFKKKGKLN